MTETLPLPVASTTHLDASESTTERDRAWRVTDVPGAATALVAMSASGLVAWVMARSPEVTALQAVPAAALAFFAAWSLAVVWDLPSVKRDAARGAQTLPVYLGRADAADLAALVALGAAVAGVGLARAGLIAAWIAAAVVINALGVVAIARRAQGDAGA